MNISVDLHIHSWYSDDGEYMPPVLAERCQTAGITVMSITDHNCVQANAEARSAAVKLGLQYISGVEIDCTFEGINLHVLGYHIDDTAPVFTEIEKNIDVQSRQASQKMLQATRDLGFEIDVEALQKLTRGRYCPAHWTGEMFAEVLLDMQAYCSHPLLEPYRTGGERSDNPYVNFYWDFYAQGRPCHAEMQYPTLEEIVQIIHKTGGYAILAHPGVNLEGKNMLLQPIFKTGLDGIEAYSSYHTPEQCVFYQSIAKENGLKITCGSDFHGKIKPLIALGQHGCEHEIFNSVIY